MNSTIVVWLLLAIAVGVVVFGTLIACGENRHYKEASLMNGAIQRLAESLGVLSRVCAATQFAFYHRRNAILVVDDCEFDLEMVRGLCGALADRHRLVVQFAKSLDDVYGELPTARVVVLDVVMADTSIGQLNALIDLVRASCPVIINSVNDYPEGTFPNAFAVVQKHQSADRLVEVIEAAIVSTSGVSP